MTTATLPICWELAPGEDPATTAEAASALLQLLNDTSADAEPCLAQLGAAPDLTDQARDLGLQLQALIEQARQVAQALEQVAGDDR
jgi:uncharacterized protein (DUF1501 family)